MLSSHRKRTLLVRKESLEPVGSGLRAPRRQHSRRKLSLLEPPKDLEFDDTEDSPSKHKVLPMFHFKLPQWPRIGCGGGARFRWKRLFLATLLLHSFWLVTVLHSRVLTTSSVEVGNNLHMQSEKSQLRSSTTRTTTGHEEDDDLLKRARQRRSQQRRKRTTPNSVTTDNTELSWTLFSPSTRTLNVTNHDWTKLCAGAQLDAKSRVVVVNPFDEGSPAFAMTLLLHQQCHVTDIAVLDPVLPNIPKRRAALLDRYLAPLQRHIPTLRPLVGSGWNSEPGVTHNYHPQLPKNPTHVLYFPCSTLPLPEEESDGTALLLNQANQRLLSLRSAALQAEQIRSYLSDNTSHTPVSVLKVSYESTHGLFDNVVSGWNNQAALVLSNFVALHQIPSVTLNHISLPRTFGPAVFPLEQKNNNAKSNLIFIEDALAAMLQSMDRVTRNGHYRVVANVPAETVPDRSWLTIPALFQHNNATTILQSLAWLSAADDSPSLNGIQLDPAVQVQLERAEERTAQVFGWKPSRLPCQTVCNRRRLSSCERSIWDDIAPVSQAATLNCSHVAYQISLDPAFDNLPKMPLGLTDELCRLVFVSDSSPMVDSAIYEHLGNKTEWSPGKKEWMQLLNGRVNYHGWTMIWMHVPEASLSPGANAIPIIDPKMLFAKHIVKAMYLNSPEFAEGIDALLLRIMHRVDLRNAPNGESIKERRAGTQLSRWKKTPPHRARKALFFVGAAGFTPQNVLEYAELVKDMAQIPAHQLSYYQQVSQLLRYEDERSMKINEFPFEWVSLGVFIHDFVAEESQQFRCDWFEEYIAWGDNREAEELSLAYRLGLQHRQGKLGWTEDSRSSWLPLLDDLQQPRVNENNEELYIRILQRQL